MKTIKKLSLVVLMLFSTSLLFSQALVTDQEEVIPPGPHSSALLELRTDGGTQGFLPPSVLMINDINGDATPANEDFPAPADGLVIYNPGGTGYLTTGLWYYDGYHNKWVIYSKAGDVNSLSVENYGELFESNLIGEYTPYSTYLAYWTPWSTAGEGIIGEKFISIPSYPATGTNGQNSYALKTTEAGIYQVNVTGTFQALSSGNVLVGALFVDNTIVNKINFRFNFQTSNDVASLSASGLIELDLDEVVDLRFTTTTTTESIGLINMNVLLTKIGEIPVTP